MTINMPLDLEIGEHMKPLKFVVKACNISYEGTLVIKKRKHDGNKRGI